MVRKINYGKIVVVVFLTVLIWVWADLAKTEEFAVPNATINVAEAANPFLWVSFANKPSASINEVVLKGPASKISEVRRKVNDGSLKLEFSFYAAKEGMIESGQHVLDVLGLLKKSDQVRGLGLTVESCEPNILDVQVVKLVNKLLTVECFDENRTHLKAQSIEPVKVEMAVPDDWEGAKLVAAVRLRAAEIEQARLSPIEKRPYIELAGGQRREAATTVRITMPPAEDQLTDYTITAPTLGITLSPTLQGKYRVEITNLTEVLGVITIRATSEAKRAYEQQQLPSMTLYILDDDVKKAAVEQRRKVLYNFPQEFVRTGEIELKNPQQPAEARFKLTPLPASAGQ